MFLQLLHQLANRHLPAVVVDDDEVEAVRLLVMAGHAKASVPAPVRTLSGHDQPPAVVTEITPLGRVFLERFPVVA